MILTRLIFVSACAALAPSKHEQQAVAAGNSGNSFFQAKGSEAERCLLQ